LRIHDQVQHGVGSPELVETDDSDSLLTHGALVRVTRTLVVVRIGNNSSYQT
jgi:hypothetical protein